MNVTGVVMAAGFGTRLRPSTQYCPKPLIPVGGVEPLFFALSKLHALGVRRAVVNAHYLPERVAEALERWAPLLPGLELRLSIEKNGILGTGGGLLKILREHPDFFQGAGMLVQNGDTLASFDLAPLVARPERSSFAVSYRAEHLAKYKPLWVGPQDEWVGIGPASPGPEAQAAHFLGVHYLSAVDLNKLTELAGELREIDLFNGIYRPLSDTGSRFNSRPYFQNAASSDFWFDMTNQEFLLEAQRHVLGLMLTLPDWGKLLEQRYPGIRETEPGIWVASARDLPRASYRRPVVLVESQSSGATHELGRLTLGPDACLICETGRFDSTSVGKEFRVSNAVVLVGLGSDQALPEKVCDEICVI